MFSNIPYCPWRVIVSVHIFEFFGSDLPVFENMLYHSSWPLGLNALEQP